MKIVDLNINKFSRREIELASNYVKAGKIVVIPTDTIYGLSASAKNKKAVNRIYEIKKRNKNKPLVLLMKNYSMVKKYCCLKKDQYSYVKKEVDKGRPVTFILKNKSKKLNYLANERGGVSVRIPFGSLFLIKLLRKINDPIVSTSLNVSGENAILDLKNLSEKIDVKKIDLVLDVGKIERNRTSKIVDIMDMSNIKVIRK